MSDQSIIPLFIAGSLLITMFAVFLFAVLFDQVRRKNRDAIEKQKLLFEHENSLLKAKIDEHETTLDALSKELHDNVKSVLGFAQMSMYRIAELSTTEKQTALIDNTNKMIGQVIVDISSLSHSMNSNFIRNIGLVETITKDLGHIQSARNIMYKIEITGNEVSLNPEKELQLYRIAQEAIQNCVKHAKATMLTFALDYADEALTMTIKDNGIGFDKDKIFEMKGIGLINMMQRARYVDGMLDFQSVPKQGSTVTLTLKI